MVALSLGRGARAASSAALALGLAVSLAACGSDDEGADGAVKITSAADATGPTADTQVPYQAGVKAYFDAYNDDLSEGQHEIEVQYLDDKYDVATGLANYRAAKSNGSVAMIGPNGSAQQPVLAEQGLDIPLLSGITTTILDNEFVWNTLPTFDPDQASIMVNHAMSQSDEPLRVAGLFFNVPSGVGFAKSLKEATEAAGGTYLGDVPIEAADAGGDWRAQALKLAELEPNFVGVLGSASNPQTFLPALANAGLDDIQVGAVTPLGLYKENWTDVPASLGSKFFVISSITPADIESAGSEEIQAAAEAAGEESYANNLYFVQGYVNAGLMAEAVNNAGDSPTAESVNEALGEVTDWTVNDINTPFCFGSDDHYASGVARPLFVDLETGKFTAAGEFADYVEFVRTDDGTCD